MKLLSTLLRKMLKYEILLKSVHWELSSSMRTDRHDEANNGFWRLKAYGDKHCRPEHREQQEITEANEHHEEL